MSIQFYEKEQLFKLDTKNTTYAIGIVDEEKFLGHIYYGAKLEDYHVGYIMRTDENPFVPSKNNRDRVSFLDSFAMEYPAHGLGDYRESAVSIRTMQGHTGLSLSYVSHKITEGKQSFEALPSSFGAKEDCSVLEILCEDTILGLQVVLQYGVFEDVDVITRSVKVINKGKEPVYLTKVYSACLDMDNKDFVRP